MFNIEKDKSLAEYTTFKIDGPAKFFVEIFDEKALLQAVEFAQEKKLPIFVLGGGSNILVSDRGFEGLVILNRIKGAEIDEEGLVAAGAGEGWDDVVKRCVEKGLAGVECLSGVPGSVGGAVVQNIGAYGQTFGDVVEKVRAFDILAGEVKELSATECDFSYRHSVFKNDPNYIVTYVVFKLATGGKPRISYHDLVAYFEGKTSEPGLAEVREAVLAIRKSKGMVVTNDNESFKSAGSYFKNPVVDRAVFEKIAAAIPIGDAKKPWYWELQDGSYKVAAAKLINEAGFKKGDYLGRAAISPKHTLTIINQGSASAADILEFSQKIKQAVQNKFGVELKEEVEMVGNFEPIDQPQTVG